MANPLEDKIGIPEKPRNDGPGVVDVVFSATPAIDFSNGRVQHLILTGDINPSFATTVDGATYVLLLEQDATGGHQVSWPLGVHFGTIDGKLSTAAHAVDVFELVPFAGKLFALPFKGFS
jgi:hypothetical protein